MTISDKQREHLRTQGKPPPPPRQGHLEDALKRRHAAEDRHAAEEQRRRLARKRIIHERASAEYAQFALDRWAEARFRDPRSRFYKLHERDESDDMGTPELRDAFIAHLDADRLMRYTHDALPRLQRENPRAYAAHMAVFYDDALTQPVRATPERQAAAAAVRGQTLAQLHAQLNAGVALLAWWTRGNLPDPIALYVFENKRAIAQRERRRRRRAAAGDG